MRTNQLLLNKLRGFGIFSLIAEALTLPPPGSDAIEFRHLRAAQRTTEARLPPSPVLERINHWFWTRRQRDIEARLAKATDVYDLEARLRALERTVPHPYY